MVRNDACRLYSRVGGGRRIIQFSAMQSRLHHARADGVGGGGGRSFVRLLAAVLHDQGCTAAAGAIRGALADADP